VYCNGSKVEAKDHDETGRGYKPEFQERHTVERHKVGDHGNGQKQGRAYDKMVMAYLVRVAAKRLLAVLRAAAGNVDSCCEVQGHIFDPGLAELEVPVYYMVTSRWVMPKDGGGEEHGVVHRDHGFLLIPRAAARPHASTECCFQTRCDEARLKYPFPMEREAHSPVMDNLWAYGSVLVLGQLDCRFETAIDAWELYRDHEADLG
jgi:hypothetical protein